MIEVDVGLTLGTLKLKVAFQGGQGLTALFGRSGCGKSVTLSLIAGLLKPDEGFIRLDGNMLVDMAQKIFLPPHQRRIGVVFQDSNLFPHLSVRQNLLYGRWFAPKEGRKIDFDAVVDTLGIRTLLDRRPHKLSGGERQRVAIGRTLLSDPKLLLFDEPLAALDMARKREIIPLIEHVRDDFGIPIIYVSHSIEEVIRLASRVVMLDAGQVKMVGTPDEVFTDSASLEDRFDSVSVVTAEVLRHDRLHEMTELQHPAGRIWIGGAVEHSGRVRVAIAETAVVLSTEAFGPLSIRTILSGTVSSIENKGPFARVLVALEGRDRLAVAVTRQAVEDLNLQNGRKIFALIKSASIDEGLLSNPAP